MELGLKEIKEVSLKVMDEIDCICKKNDIRYSLGYGTLLGAVRHGGFIPWDDDIDILMTRENYERFLVCAKNSDVFSLLEFRIVDNYAYLFAKASDNMTRLIEHNGNRYGCDMGVSVDIFPIDYLDDTYKGAVKKINRMKIKRLLLVAANWKKYFRSKTHSFIFEPVRLLLYLLSRGVNEKRILEGINTYYSREHEKKYSANAVDNNYGLREIMESYLFEEYVEIDFENRKYSMIKYYDEYLKKIYGDYMKLPPIDKQITHHTFSAYFR